MKQPTIVILLDLFEYKQGFIIRHRRRSDSDRTLCVKHLPLDNTAIKWNSECPRCETAAKKFDLQQQAELAKWRAFTAVENQEDSHAH